jgi:17beta-estradiol 17-dehydrogenase / very-long-chain 3-oxoacyl-CoA reductase
MESTLQSQLTALGHSLQHLLSRRSVQQPLAALGLFTTGYALTKLFWALYLFLRPSSLPRSRHASGQPYLTYALVTGASDGIGRALCFELSRRGFALVLHGRNPTKLAAMADELHATFAAQGAPRPLILVAQADYCDKIDFKALVAPLQKLRLTVLVNNVGAQGHMAHDPYRTLPQHDRQDVERLVDLNLRFMALLTRELTPLLLRASDPKVADAEFEYPVPLKRSVKAKAPMALILNASSAAAIGIPYVSVYAGSKGFVESFSKALSLEFRAEGYKRSRIDVMGLRIGNVRTNTNAVAERLFVPDADRYAKKICERVGCGEPVVVPFFWHWLQVVFFSQLSPQWVLDWGIIYNIKHQIAETNEARHGKKQQ